MTLAVVEAVYSRSTPGVNAPKLAFAPIVSDSVAATVPPALPVASVAYSRASFAPAGRNLAAGVPTLTPFPRSRPGASTTGSRSCRSETVIVCCGAVAQDSQYLRTATGQQSVTVSDLQLRLPVVDAPGRDLGNGVTVASPAAKVLPPGAKLARDYATEATGGAGGTVPATLALTLGAPASFGAFTPGVDREYTAATTATVTSTAADAALTVSEPGRLTNGAFSLNEPLRVEIAPATWTGPVSNGAATITFRQHIGAQDALRTGAYTRTLTFTLSTTNP